MEHFLPVCSFLSDFSFTSIGPNGSSKLVHPHPRSKKVSFSTKSTFLYQNDRFTLGKSSQPDTDDFDQSNNQAVDRTINGMLRIFFSTLTSHSDGGHLFVIITTNLLLQCSPQSVNSSIYPSSHPFCHFPRQIISNCQQQLIGKCCDFLSQQSVLLSLNKDWQIILRAIESQFLSKPVLNYQANSDSTYANRLAALIFQSYLCVFNQSSSPEMLTRIRLHAEVAVSSSNSPGALIDQSDFVNDNENECGMFLMNGVLVDVALPLVFRNRDSDRVSGVPVFRDLSVVVYDVSLAFTDEESRGGFSASAVEGDEDFLIAARNRLIDRLVDKWIAMKIKAVFCQKVIHASMKHRLCERDILYLERLSIRHIAAIQSVSQCRLVSGLSPELITEDHIGHVGMVKEIRLNRRSQLFVGDSEDTDRRSRCGICTLVLTHTDHAYLAELERCVRSALASFVTAIQHDAEQQMCVAVCHGGGHVERALADHCGDLAKEAKQQYELLKSKADMSKSRVMHHRFTSAARFQMLEVAMLEEFVRLFHSIADCLADVLDDEEPTLVIDSPAHWEVVDFTVVKRRALMNAVETAGILMRITTELTGA